MPALPTALMVAMALAAAPPPPAAPRPPRLPPRPRRPPAPPTAPIILEYKCNHQVYRSAAFGLWEGSILWPTNCRSCGTPIACCGNRVCGRDSSGTRRCNFIDPVDLVNISCNGELVWRNCSYLGGQCEQPPQRLYCDGLICYAAIAIGSTVLIICLILCCCTGIGLDDILHCCPCCDTSTGRSSRRQTMDSRPHPSDLTRITRTKEMTFDGIDAQI